MSLFHGKNSVGSSPWIPGVLNGAYYNRNSGLILPRTVQRHDLLRGKGMKEGIKPSLSDTYRVLSPFNMRWKDSLLISNYKNKYYKLCIEKFYFPFYFTILIPHKSTTTCIVLEMLRVSTITQHTCVFSPRGEWSSGFHHG